MILERLANLLQVGNWLGMGPIKPDPTRRAPFRPCNGEKGPGSERLHRAHRGNHPGLRCAHVFIEWSGTQTFLASDQAANWLKGIGNEAPGLPFRLLVFLSHCRSEYLGRHELRLIKRG